MNEAELRSLLPPERRLPADRRSDIEEQLMATITRESGTGGIGPAGGPTGDGTDDLATRRDRRRRRTIGGIVGVAAALGVSTAAAAAVVNLSQPDPEEAARVNERNAPMAEEIYLPGWRQELDAETVTCVYPVANPEDPSSPETVRTPASEFPLDGMLTVDHLAAECASGTDAADQPANAAVVCVTDATVPRPVVLLGRGTCDENRDIDLEPMLTGDLVPITDEHVAELNRLRAIEVSLLAIPTSEDCPTLEEARVWAEEQIDQQDVDLVVRGESEGPGCYLPHTYWDQRLENDQADSEISFGDGGMVWVQPYSQPAPDEQ